MPFNWAKHDICETSEAGGFIAVYPVMQLALADLALPEISWADSLMRRRFRVGMVTKDEPDEFAWVDSIGREHFLRPLTTEAWMHLKNRVPWAGTVPVDYPALRLYGKLLLRKR